MKKNQKAEKVSDQIAQAAEALYGEEMYLTDPATPEAAEDPLSLPSTQTGTDTRKWVMDHQT